MTLVIS